MSQNTEIGNRLNARLLPKHIASPVHLPNQEFLHVYNFSSIMLLTAATLSSHHPASSDGEDFKGAHSRHLRGVGKGSNYPRVCGADSD